MNKIYRSLWNEATRTWAAVSENAKGRGKRTAGRVVALAFASSTVVLAAPPNPPAPTQLPTGARVVAGTANISQAGATLAIQQSTERVAIDWQSFNIGASAAVAFSQPSASAIALNRVQGVDPSQLFGRLSANGRVFLLNPNGILFAPGAQVDVGGLLASTLAMSADDFMSGRYLLRGDGAGGTITNAGTLRALPQGYVALIAPRVVNDGTIDASRGTAALVAANAATVDFMADGLIRIRVDEGALNAEIANRGAIGAAGGAVLLTAKGLQGLGRAVVNNSGIIEARTLENRNGTITLLGDMAAGTVMVGGVLDASAPNGGDGGFIETSAANVRIADDARVTTAAPSGKTGTWLIDPVDFKIAAGSGALTASGIGATTLSTSLGSSNVSIATAADTSGNGDIVVNSAVSWSANKLTLSAHRNININADLNASNTAILALNFGQGAVALNNTSNIVTKGGAVNLPAGTANFTTRQGSDGTVKAYRVITGSSVDNDLAGIRTGASTLNYALGSDIDATATGGFGQDFEPIFTAGGSPFSGTFDGLGHTINNLTVNRPATAFVGLFGTTGTGSNIRNVGLVGGSMSGSSQVGGLVGSNSGGTISNSYATGSVRGSGDAVGGLVGLNIGGAISNSYATGSVVGSSGVGGLVGGTTSSSSTTGSGLVGGRISNSFATGSVSGSGGDVGGLVGLNDFGRISDSYATGSVSGSVRVGGLVGRTISNSSTTGSVSGSSAVPGLVGGTVSNSYATGRVSGSGDAVGGLVGSNSGGAISNSYWDIGSTGQSTAGQGGSGATGLTTANMKVQANFTGFNIANTGGSGAVWRIYEGQTTPLLTSFLKPLTATSTSVSMTYKGAPYSDGYGVSFSVANPNPAPSGTLVFSGSSQSAVNAGSYTIDASGLHSVQQGFDISYVAGTLTINKAPLTVSADSQSRLYGAANPTFTQTVSGFVNSETLSTSGVSGTATGSSAAGAGTGAGTASIVASASGLSASNYAFTTLNIGTLTIAKAPLTVSADSQSRLFGAANPTFTQTISGFVNSETLSTSGVSGTATGSSAAGVGTGVGTASIVASASGLSASNYEFTTLNNGTLTINTAPLTLTAAVAAVAAAPASIVTSTTTNASAGLSPSMITITTNSPVIATTAATNPAPATTTGTTIAAEPGAAPPPLATAATNPAPETTTGTTIAAEPGAAPPPLATATTTTGPTGGAAETPGTTDSNQTQGQGQGQSQQGGSTQQGSGGQKGEQRPQQAGAQKPVAQGATRAAAMLVAAMTQMRELKVSVIEKAVRVLEQNPSIADLKPCAGGGSGNCIADRPLPDALRGAGSQSLSAPKISHLPAIERKVALLIGINDYEGGIPKLDSPIKDTQEIGNIYKEHLGYEVRTLPNADKATIVSALNRLIRESGPNDSVTVMYAGHGHVVEKTQRGYWIPAKASANDPSQWISNEDIAKVVANIPAKQIMLVSDSCYSGNLASQGKIEKADVLPNLQQVLAQRSVAVLTSGGNEPVPDQGKDGHSVFAWHFMQQLKGVKTVSGGVDMFASLSEGVKADIPQAPQYGAGLASGHQRGGDYLFEVRRYD